MDIKLKGEGGDDFTFSSLPERISVSGAAKYQDFSILSKGSVRIPAGTDVTSYSWDGVFFGAAKLGEAIVKTEHWLEPCRCVEKIQEWMEKGTELNLIVTDTWINADVTISSFRPTAYGAYGNVEYSIAFEAVKDLRIYTTKELKVGSSKKKKTRGRGGRKKENKSYTVKKGDTIYKIAMKKYKTSQKWTAIYKKNKKKIEDAAKKHGKKNSDKGYWLYPGTKLMLP